MELRIDLRLQVEFHDHLGHPVCNRGNAQRSLPASRLGYIHQSDRIWEVRARGHPIPDLVEVSRKVLLKIRNRLFIHTWITLVGPNSFPGLPDCSLGNVKRLCLAQWFFPSMRLTTAYDGVMRPLRSDPISGSG